MKVTVYITVDQWSDTIYAQLYDFHTLPNMLKNLLERGFAMYSGAYGRNTIGHSVGPLVLTLFICRFADFASGGY